MKRTLIFILVCLSASLLKAQQVSGRLVDSNNKPVGYANVVLQQADSTFVKGCTTDAKGLFDLQTSTTGQYRLVISYIGYETLAIDLSLPRGKKRLGDITLMEAAETLGEVQVVGARTIQKIDRQVIVPSQSQLESSSTSYQLLNKLMLPNLTVDVIQNNVQTDDGGSVEFRINGVKVSHNQVMSLNTRRVERVEYIDNPGVRYGNTNVKAVINYIVKQRDDGYEGGVFANNAAYKPGIFGNNNLFGYVNKGNSQWGLEYSMGYRDYDNRRQNSTQEFLTDTNQKRTREQQGIDMPFGYTQHQIEVSYTYNKVDNRMFRAVFSDEIWRTDKQDFASIIRETNYPDIYSKTHISDHYQAPALDLYAEWNLPHNQTLMFNAVGTYISSDFSRDYRESLFSNGDMLSNYAYSTDGNHYSFIFEGNYDRSWGSTTLSIGAKESMSYTNNEYTGINEAGLNMHTNNLYGYAQLQGRLSKLNYFVGAGVARDEFSRGSKGYTFVTFRPSVSLYLPLFSGAGIRYFFNVFSYTPSLSQLSEVSQQLSDFEYSIGNEQLSPYRGYQHYVTLSWRIKNISTSLSFYSIVNHDPIITKSEREGTGEDAKFIYRWINADRFSQLGSILNLRWNILPDKLSLNLKGRVNRYNTRGEGFDYKYTWWSGTASVDYTAKQWTFSASASSRMNRLSGEEISYGEKNSAITAGYRLNKHLDLSLMWMYPLQAQGWTAGSKNLSDLTPNRKWTRIKENGNMITLMVYWRFNGGRSFNRGNKQLNNSDRDSGIAK